LHKKTGAQEISPVVQAKYQFSFSTSQQRTKVTCSRRFPLLLLV